MRNGKSILVCLLALCGILALLLLLNDNVYTELTFSRESGFYGEPFELEIYAPPGTEIYYTLDGSVPDENAIKYTAPIFIDDATKNDNVHSMRTDVSAGFLTDEIAYYGLDDPHYTVPDYPIDKCTVVRSAYRDAGGNFSDIKTESYFIGYDAKTGYDGLNVISIVTEPDNLFDYNTGIYVLGQKYDEFAAGDRESMWENSIWEFWDANYRQSGYEWERAANIELFDPEKNRSLNRECGIRIQGGGSRGYIPRSINIYAREQYDGGGRLFADLFGTDYMADTVTLFAGGDDYISKMRDVLISNLVSDRNFATMNYKPYALFLDGEYWGVYWLTEKYDAVYVGHYYDVDKDNVIMVKNYYPEEGEEHYDLYTQMINFITNSDMSDIENYEYACDLIDMQSYIDYYAAEIYIGRQGDWPGTNEALWRTYQAGDNPFEDNKWRWLLFDVNSDALTTNLVDANTLTYVMYKSPMFKNLCQNADFKRQFVTTFMDISNTSFAAEKVNAAISDYTDLMTEPMNVHHKRFFGESNEQLFLNAVADVQSFLNNRKPYIVQYLKDDFDLVSVLAPVEIEISDPAAGSIVLNTIEPSFHSDGKWSGEYFTDYPITLTASARDGYRFVEWEVTDSGQRETLTEDTIEIDISDQGTSIKAIFEKADK